MTGQTAFSHVPKEPRLYGVIDVLRPDRVAGWVIDRTDPARCATVELRREGRLIATAAANRPRKDLERQSVGTGAYGFAFTLDPPLEDGMEFTIAVTARSHDGVDLSLSPVAGAAKDISAEKRALGQVLSQLTGLRAEIAGLQRKMAAEADGRAQFQERLELVQLRLERWVSAEEPPRRGAPGWLTGIAVAGALLGAGSLALGLLSLWSA